MADAKADKKQKPQGNSSVRLGAQQPDLPDFHFDEPKKSSQPFSHPQPDENIAPADFAALRDIDPKSLVKSIVTPNAQNLTPSNVVNLQRLHGNQFVNQLVIQYRRNTAGESPAANASTPKITPVPKHYVSGGIGSSAALQRDPDDEREDGEQARSDTTSDSMQASAAVGPPPPAVLPPPGHPPTAPTGNGAADAANNGAGSGLTGSGAGTPVGGGMPIAPPPCGSACKRYSNWRLPC